jgi:lipoic acid synthetase
MATRILVDHRAGGAAPTGVSAPSAQGEVMPAPRHPEKAHRADNPIKRKPDWIRVRAPNHPIYHETRALMRRTASSRCARRRPARTSGSAGRSGTPR